MKDFISCCKSCSLAGAVCEQIKTADLVVFQQHVKIVFFSNYDRMQLFLAFANEFYYVY